MTFLLVVQIPLYDPRGLPRTSGESRLDVPPWPKPLPGKDFIRSSGAAFERRKLGLHGFFAEDVLCNARRFVRFGPFSALRVRYESDFGAEDASATARSAFRHLFTDGLTTGKLEMGFHTPRTERAVALSNLTDFVETTLLTDVYVGSEQTRSTLIAAGEAVAAAFERATGKHPPRWRRLLKLAGSNRKAVRVRAGPPLALLTASGWSGVIRPPPNGRYVELGAVQVGAWRRRLEDQPYDLVIISEDGRPSDLARNLRLFLNRIHAELVSAEFAFRDIEVASRGASGSSRKRAALVDEIERIRTTRLISISALTRRVGIAARALRGGGPADPVEVGGEVLASIWGGRVDAALERADIISSRLVKGEGPSSRPRDTGRGLIRSVFISYRRRDTEAFAEQLARFLRKRFPRVNVFRDRENLNPGGDWPKELSAEISARTHVIALIGPRWAGTATLGQRQIDNPIDPVRLEIAAALELEKAVLPVVVEGAAFPTDDLPSPLKRLARKNALFLGGIADLPGRASDFERFLRRH